MAARSGVSAILDLLHDRGAKSPALGAFELPAEPLKLLDGPHRLLYDGDGPGIGAWRDAGWQITRLTEAQDIDAVVVLDYANYGAFMRRCEPLSQRGVVVVPSSPDAIAPLELRELDAMQTAWQTSQAANYVARCGLKGHYLEFGTWYGRSFFRNYYELRHWLNGNFYGFDSFVGLSKPLPLELSYTAGDFYEGSYTCNVPSFETVAEIAGMPRERLRVIPGFYRESLAVPPATYGLEPGSVSVCVIDCDIKEPTEQALRFITPLLEPGALIYFDDWRLTRASAEVGERAAALDWLRANPTFDLIELHRDLWQHQWFIFQRPVSD